MARENGGTRWSELSGWQRARAITALASLPAGVGVLALHASSGGTPDTGVATASASATGHPLSGPSADRSPIPGHSPTVGASPYRISLTEEPSIQGGKRVYDVNFACPPGRTGVVSSGTVPWDIADGRSFVLKDNVYGSGIKVDVDPAKAREGGLSVSAEPGVEHDDISVGNRRATIEFDTATDPTRGVVLTASCGISIPSPESSA